ncbi:MAG TPA: DUF72 domain-containing protein, partial [Planctomycetota bacterium]|nr:DUF72 domain-containing protein [Planctomycetota bacterium]
TLAPLPLAIELRHASFLETGPGGGLPFLASLGVGFVNIDLPRSNTSPPPTSITTSDIGYFRLHGRNRSKWFDRRATRDEKYDYRYSLDELASLLPLIDAIARHARATYVITNNHFRGQAPANALELAELLSARRSPNALGTTSPGDPRADRDATGDARRHGETP